MPEIMDAVGLTDAYLVTNCLAPLLQADRTRYFHHKGKVKDIWVAADNNARLKALDMALRIKGKYAPPPVEQARKRTVDVIIMDIPRPKRDHPPPTVIELARSAYVLPQPGASATGQPTNVLPSPNVLPNKGNGNR
jgi:hypothetical protein